jgi:hypothetical protein
MYHIRGNERARYGQPIVAQVAIETEREFGRNFLGENFEEEDRFHQEFPDFNILPPVMTKLN